MEITHTRLKLERLKMDDLTGKVFGKRTVLQRVEKTASREWSYLCRCVCGKEDVVRGSSLRAGKSHQCHACSAAETKNRTSHGLSKTPIYQSWKAMLNRCSVPTDPNYANYGGRGINVCSAWLNAENFYEWSVNNGWAKGLSIDRIDVNAGYSPENCRWATSSQQRENVQLITRSNKSGYRGVSKKHERDCWLARITVSGKITHLGHHKTALEAALAHDKYIHDNGLVRPMNFQNPYEVEARAAEWKDS